MANYPKSKILLIEDDPAQILLYQTKFKMEGLKLIACQTGKEGLSLSEKEKPGLILLDLVLVGENGLDILEKLKDNPATKNIPVVILTNLVQAKIKEKAKKLGATDFIVKTEMMPSDIVKRVREIYKSGSFEIG